MIVKLLVDKKLIPDDGSKRILNMLENKLDAKHSNIIIYPDIHYKRGRRVVNGMLYSSDKYILPAGLGVDNCGFTVGKIITKLSKEELQESFMRYAANRRRKQYKEAEIKKLFAEYIKQDFFTKKALYTFLGFDTIEQLLPIIEKIMTKDILNLAAGSLGKLGGGNHFFELHEVIESDDEKHFAKGDKICFLHSDSIAVGDYVNCLFSNLSELDIVEKSRERKRQFRKKQIKFFVKSGLLFRDTRNVCRLLFSQKDYRVLDVNSETGKILLLYHNFAAVFGDMNRDTILNEWADLSNISYRKLFSHSHDSISMEMYDGKSLIVQRNGVQFLGNDDFYVLPGAMGTCAYILRNTKNRKTYYSANHGTGRFHDKHVAKKLYSKKETIQGLKNKSIKLYKVGNGNIAEQSYKAFKSVDEILAEMEKRNLGEMVVKMQPFAIMKG